MTTLLDCWVPGDPVPWKAPSFAAGRRPYKPRRLADWQTAVHYAVRASWGKPGPFAGPVELDLDFTLPFRGGRMADATNLQKAVEDALQGAVIANDAQVRRVTCRRGRLAKGCEGEPGVRIRVLDPIGGAA